MKIFLSAVRIRGSEIVVAEKIESVLLAANGFLLSFPTYPESTHFTYNQNEYYLYPMEFTYKWIFQKIFHEIKSKQKTITSSSLHHIHILSNHEAITPSPRTSTHIRHNHCLHHNLHLNHFFQIATTTIITVTTKTKRRIQKGCISNHPPPR